MAFKFDASEQKDLDKFLQKVDDLEEIVKGFKSADVKKHKDMMAKADDMLKRETSTAFNKTVINKEVFAASDQTLTSRMSFSSSSMDQEAFLHVLESDAKQRAEARKERQEKASVVKDEANGSFKKGDYETAAKLYSKAIGICNDMKALYTNRAMAYVKLGQYQEAIEDCDMAKRVDVLWTKAYVIKGNALRGLRKYEEAKQSYKEILEHHPKKEKIVDEYVRETEAQHKEEELEEQARKSLEGHEPASNAVANLVRMLGTRVTPKCETEEITFASTAATMKMLAGKIENNLQAQVLFRQEGGFKILAAKPFLRDVLFQSSFELGQKSDFAEAALALIRVACFKCPQNTTAFFEEPMMIEMMLNLLHSNDRQVKHAAIMCFFNFGANFKIIEYICGLFTVPKLLTGFMNEDIVKLKLIQEAVYTLNKYAETERFRTEAVDDFERFVLKFYHQFIDEIGHSQRKVLPLCMHSICIFLRNDTIRKMVSANEKFLTSCVICIEKIIQILEPNSYREEMLSRMLDIAEYLLLCECPATMQIAPRLASCLLPAINWQSEEIVLKAITALTRCIERSKECVRYFESSVGLHFVKKIYKLIKNEEVSMRSYALKIICHCGQTRVSTLKNVPKFDKRYSILRKVLSRDQTEADLLNQGHAAILFGFLSQLPGGMDPLVEYNDDASNVVKYMLELTRNAKKEHTKYNCALALGKMASNDGRILGELRRFDGINILSKNKPPDV